MKSSYVLNIIGIIIGIMGSIITLVGIAISILAMQQPQPEPICVVGNIVAEEGATVNINCSVVSQ